MTEAIPEPPSLVVELRATVPERSAPGLPIVAVGAVLSTRTEMVAEVWTLPALSVVTTRRSYWPSACPVVSQLLLVVKVPGRCERLELDGATPEPPCVECSSRRRCAADVGRVQPER